MYTQCNQNIIVPLPEPLKKNLQQNFESKYKFPSGISWQIFIQDWCRYLETDPPTPPTVRAIFSEDKNTCEYRIADGLCQLLSKCSYDDWIDQLREEMEKTFFPPDFTEINQSLQVESEQNTKQSKQSISSNVKWEIRLEADQELADAIYELVKEYSGDTSLVLNRITQGSIILELEGSLRGFKRIEKLFASKDLNRLLGVPVLQVQITKTSETVNLSQWFDKLFGVGWRAAREILSPKQLTPVFWGNSVNGAKLIDLSLDLVKHTVILLISLTKESETQIEVRLQIYPQGENTYLPANLQLLVRSEGKVFQEVISRSADQFIQCQFSGIIGDRFSVSVTLEQASITEDFVI